MSTPQAIDQKLAKSLSDKPDEELIAVLEKPADWRPEVVDFVRSELERRSISNTQIEKALIDRTEQRASELQERSNVPLTFWESFFPILYGGCVGLLGGLILAVQARRFKSEGYILKWQKSWRFYWIAFGVRTLVVTIFIFANFTKR